MIIDSGLIPKSDMYIIGAVAADIALTLKIKSSARNITVFESGEREPFSEF